MKLLKRIATVAVLGLAAVGATKLWPTAEPIVDVYYQTPFGNGPYGVVGFPSFNANSGHDFQNGGATAPKQSSGGTLVLPPGASADNPVPAMVILHGSGGDCLMKWMADGSNVEMTTGYSVDNPFGAFRAFSKCGSRDGYTMGYNESAYRQSFVDLWQFLRRTWQLDGPAIPVT